MCLAQVIWLLCGHSNTVGPKIFAWTIFSDGNYFRIFAYAKSRTVILEYLHSKTLLVVCQYKF